MQHTPALSSFNLFATNQHATKHFKRDSKNMLTTKKASFIIGLSIAMTACNSSDKDKNTAPVITMGTTIQTQALQNSQVTLSAVINDKEDNLSRQEWSLVSGPSTEIIEFDNSSSLTTKFLAPNIAGEYIFRLTAFDQEGLKTTANTTLKVTSLAETMTPILDALIQEKYLEYAPYIANLAFMVNFKGQDYTWQGAAGFADVSEQTPMTPQHTFRIASISKTIVTGLAFKLIELGYLTLDTTLAELLMDTDMPAGYTVDDLHVMQNIKRGGTITIRQLLDQSTGIRDHISYLKDPLSPDFISIAATLLGGIGQPEPELWTPQLLLKNILDRGLTKNLESLPGEKKIYGNSNTDILGIVLEKVTNDNLQNLLTQHLFVPLNMHNTYMEHHQAARGPAPVDHYFLIREEDRSDGMPDHLIANHNINELNINTSYAWAGGGLVSTLSDIERFFAAIDNNTLITDSALIAEWHNWKGVADQDEDAYYSLGQWHRNVNLNGRNHHFSGHEGAWGSQAWNFEPLEVRIITWDSQEHDVGAADLSFINEVIITLNELGYNIKP
jgi:D-alanyl-D-alanine carboxypeptidase